MKIFFKKINLFLILFLIFLSCIKKDKTIFLFPTKYKLPFDILKQEFKIKEIINDDEIKIKEVKLWYKKGKSKIEIKEQNKKRIIILDEKNLYLLDENSKTGYRCDRASDLAIKFLGEVIINSGVGGTKERILGIEKIQGKDCFVYSYNIFTYYDGFYTPTLIKEYIDKKTERLLEMSAEIMPHYNRKKVKKELKIIKTQKWIFLSEKVFKIPKSYTIIILEDKFIKR